MLNELWAKVSAREKFIVYGAAAVIVGWLVGLILGSVNACAGISVAGISCTVNYFSWSTAGTTAILALVLAIVVIGIIYVKVAPNMASFAWPMPVAQILLGCAGAAGALALITALLNISNGLGNPPIGMYIADLLFVAGGAVMAWFAYQEWVASKTVV